MTTESQKPTRRSCLMEICSRQRLHTEFIYPPLRAAALVAVAGFIVSFKVRTISERFVTFITVPLKPDLFKTRNALYFGRLPIKNTISKSIHVCFCISYCPDVFVFFTKTFFKMIVLIDFHLSLLKEICSLFCCNSFTSSSEMPCWIDKIYNSILCNVFKCENQWYSKRFICNWLGKVV